jgi:hypothetical protein
MQICLYYRFGARAEKQVIINQPIKLENIEQNICTYSLPSSFDVSIGNYEHIGHYVVHQILNFLSLFLRPISTWTVAV